MSTPAPTPSPPTFPPALPSLGGAPHAPAHAPFLVWPVARREFYRSIGVAMLAPLAWGILIFGWRALLMLAASVLAASVVHVLLKRLTTRGKAMVYPHAVVATMTLVALSIPTWPGWLVVVLAALLPVMFFLGGGPGREQLHIAVLMVLLLQFVLLPLPRGGGFPRGTAFSVADYPPAVLARDRLLMGDIRNQAGVSAFLWPSSVDIQGNDAFRMPRPAAVAIDTLNRAAHAPEAGAGAPATGPAAAAGTRTAAPSSSSWRPLQGVLDDALANRLPSMEWVLLGTVPGRVGTVSMIGILIGGLYLAYRTILRPRSVLLYLVAFLFFLGLLTIPGTLTRGGIGSLFKVWSAFPGELFTLTAYIFFNSDAAFAAVFILALPGAEPLTPRGRRVFLVLAAFLGAALTRLPPLTVQLPGATMALTLLMPLSSGFDRLFGKRSWLNAPARLT